MKYYFNKKFDPSDLNSLQKFDSNQLVKIAYEQNIPLKKILIKYFHEKRNGQS